jgi:LysM repeat protein
VERDRLARYAAPVAFLAAVTVGVIVIRAGFEHGNHHARNPPATVTTKTTTTSHGHGHKKVQTKTYTIQSGDTFASIAVKTGTTVAELEHLNPHVDPQALHVGETIHVK